MIVAVIAATPVKLADKPVYGLPPDERVVRADADDTVGAARLSGQDKAGKDILLRSGHHMDVPSLKMIRQNGIPGRVGTGYHNLVKKRGRHDPVNHPVDDGVPSKAQQ